MKNNKIFKNTLMQILFFLFGAIVYPCIELLYRNGTTHWTMAIVGGLCFLLIVDTNFLLKKKNIILRTIISTLFVTIIELISGLIINKWACLKVWDYSNLEYNVCGQICLKFSFYWMFLCFFIIVIFDLYFLIKRKILKKIN